MNSFGKIFKFTTFGESHGKAIGCIVDGVPAGLKIDEEFIQSELDRRKPGGKYATARREEDRVEILSGVFEGVTTGTPIAMIIFNKNQKSKDYSSIKDIFRPGHADFTYFYKYGIRDYRGGGRSSARETATRVAVGAIAKLIAKEVGIQFFSGIYSVGTIEAEEVDFNFARESEIYSVDKKREEKQKEEILKAKNSHNSVGGVAIVKIKNVPIGLGEPLYYKLDGAIGEMMLGLNGVKAVEIGDGISASKKSGFENNDQISKNGFKSNHSGGILGGISNGEDIDIKIHFKPTPSIFLPQKTVDINNNEVNCKLKGRHDPCIAIRGSVVCESMSAIIITDMLLLNMSSRVENLRKIYL